MELKQQQTEAFIVKYLHSKARVNNVSVSTTFEITSRCNFRCKMCYICDGGCDKKQFELSAGEWIKVAQEARDVGVVFILLTGGEPFIREDFPEIYESLAKMGFILSINTNASLITDEHIELLKRFPPNRMNISLYGMSDEAYEKICGVPAYSKVIGNIKKLKEAGIKFVINCTVIPENASEYRKINSFCKENDIILRASSYMYPSSRINKDGSRFSPEEAAKYSVLIDKDKFSAETFRERAFRITNSLELNEEKDCPTDDAEGTGIRCRAGSSASWINWQGKMNFCGMLPANENVDVRKLGFTGCWKLVTKEAEKVVLPAKCNNCKYRNVCNVCAASVFCETGKYNEVPSYLCKMSESIAENYKNSAEEMKKK